MDGAGGECECDMTKPVQKKDVSRPSRKPHKLSGVLGAMHVELIIDGAEWNASFHMPGVKRAWREMRKAAR